MTIQAPAAAPVTVARTVNISDRPVLGILAVMLGAFISSLNTKLTTFGLADIRGGLGLGFDEASWITTVFGAAQMIVTPAAAWMSTVFSTRRVLMWTGTVFTVTSVLPPFTHDYNTLLVLLLIRGLAVGAFIPAALGFVLRSLTPKWWMWGIAAYAFRFVFSQNIAGALEGWYSEAGHWQWIFWQNAVLTPIMLILVALAMPQRPVDRVLLPRTDWAGIVYAGIGFGLIYAGLDQGNRLDWLNSGLINGLLLGGAILLVAFVVQELTTERPWINLRFVVRGNFPLLTFYIAFFRSVILSTSYIIPQFLITVQNYRALEVGGALMWIALPQFLVTPVLATILRFVDARVMLALGFTLVGCACFMAGQLTQDWVSDDFLRSQLVQGLGQSIALTSVLWLNLLNLDPRNVLTFGAVLQTARLFGGEIGNAFIQTFIRVREQVYSNLIGLHVTTGSVLTDQRLADYAQAVGARSVGDPQAHARATALLAEAVQKQAYVLAYIDGFMVLGFATIVALLLMVLLRPPPGQPMLFQRL